MAGSKRYGVAGGVGGVEDGATVGGAAVSYGARAGAQGEACHARHEAVMAARDATAVREHEFRTIDDLRVYDANGYPMRCGGGSPDCAVCRDVAARERTSADTVRTLNLRARGMDPRDRRFFAHDATTLRHLARAARYRARTCGECGSAACPECVAATTIDECARRLSDLVAEVQRTCRHAWEDDLDDGRECSLCGRYEVAE